MKVKDRELLCCFTVDTDSDQYFGSSLEHRNPADKSILGWHGFNRGKDEVVRATALAAERLNRPIPVTWFVRCDGQIDATHGSAGYLLRQYRDWWDTRLQAGDDIQWHAHLYQREGDSWVQQTDTEGFKANLVSGLTAFRDEGLEPRAVRIGEAYQSTTLMQMIDGFGLRADCSGMPGRRRIDAEKSIDWTDAPNRCYHPCKTDYRTECGDAALSIWELPMNTVYTQVSYDDEPLLRYVNPAFQPGVLDPGLEKFVPEAEVLVTIMHPFEILPEFFDDPNLQRHPLVSFDPGAVVENMEMLLKKADAFGRHLRFVTMDQLIKTLDAELV